MNESKIKSEKTEVQKGKKEDADTYLHHRDMKTSIGVLARFTSLVSPKATRKTGCIAHIAISNPVFSSTFVCNFHITINETYLYYFLCFYVK